MKHAEKIEKLKKFENEKEFREFLIDLLKKTGFQEVQHTHKYGTPEFGKDIVCFLDHQMDGKEYYAFVVKQGRILGGTNQIEEIKGQISQCFEYDHELINGQKVKINKVKIVTNEVISNGAQEAIRKSPKLLAIPNFDFWWNEKLIDLTDKHYQEFWDTGDYAIKQYAKSISSSIKNEYEIKGLSLTKLSDTKIKKLIDIYVNPSLVEYVQSSDKNNSYSVLKPERAEIKELIGSSKNLIFEGEPGCGKSRILNNIASALGNVDNILMTNIMPVKLSLALLRENAFDIDSSVEKELRKHLLLDFDRLDRQTVKIVVLVDSVDDLYYNEMQSLTKNIESNLTKYRFILTARKYDKLATGDALSKFRQIKIKNFNFSQIQNFISKYFDDVDKGKKFISILRESNILQKLPTTPLTITLISLLYDDTDYEIPATITDIYNDFCNILLGKMEVRKKLALLDLEIKRRVFSFVAFEMLKSKKQEIEETELYDKITSFLKLKGIEFQDGEDVKRLIENSGLIFIDERKRVGFKHASFLEFFAAYEIFYVRKEEYKHLIQNFNDSNWQNASIFFAGLSKDMPWFIEELLNGMPSKDLRDYIMGIGGLGYMAQALYMTDTNDRIKLINLALDQSVLAFDDLKKMTNELGPYYRMPLHLVGATMTFWFYLNFRSITLVKPMQDLFDKIIEESADKINETDFNLGYKLFLLASTLASDNLKHVSKLEELSKYECYIKDPLLVLLTKVFMNISQIRESNISAENKEKIQKELKRYSDVLSGMTQLPAYRFGENNQKINKDD